MLLNGQCLSKILNPGKNRISPYFGPLLTTPNNCTFQKCLYGTHKLLSDWEQETKKIEIVSRDTIRGSRLDLLSKTLFSEWNHKVLPPAWHHVYFPPRTRQDELADDGYERDFFPPKPFSQRMWAGASFDWNLDNPLVVNDQIEMKTKLDRVQLKEGRRGESAMVWLNKDIYNMSGWSMREQRCLVYHSEQTQETVGTNGIKMKRIPDFSMTFIPSSILLFRYSALTFNSHRIHYDHQYATEIEKHPACLVHGPLSGTLLLELFRKKIPNQEVGSFEYRCLAPLYVNHELNLYGRKLPNGNRYELWITDNNGNLAVKGSVSCRSA